MSLVTTTALDPFATAASLPRTGVKHHMRRVDSRTLNAGRVLAGGVAALALLATTPIAHAEGAPRYGACSDEIRQGLARVGGWAEAQCEATGPLPGGTAAPQDGANLT